MSDFETPIMRDISKLLLPVMIGIILAFVLMFSIMPLNSIYHSLQWELEQLDKGFTWEDKKLNGCFERESGVTYYDRYEQKEVTTTMSCSSNALPWELLVWYVPTICLMIGILLELRIRQHNSIVFELVERVIDFKKGLQNFSKGE